MSVPTRTEGVPTLRIGLLHRLAAVAVAGTIAVVGVLGLASGVGFFATEGRPIAGLSTNGALSCVSLATAAVLLAAAVRGGRAASTTMIVVGVVFLVAAFANLPVLGTAYNVLAFRLPNVFFSLGAGLLLLFLGAYGRLAGNLPDDNPYHRDAPSDDASHVQPTPRNAGEHAADKAMADAERAVSRGGGTEEQRRRLAATEDLRWHEDRRARWISLGDDGPPRPTPENDSTGRGSSDADRTRTD